MLVEPLQTAHEQSDCIERSRRAETTTSRRKTVRGANRKLVIRPSDAGDTDAVLELLQASMGWLPNDLHARFFSWKHVENPFGRSPAWVAVDEGEDRIVGFRTFLRWEFLCEGETIRATRAVDTATHPDHRGEGVFSRLTLAALEELGADGVAFIYNTPNSQSLPGYLKMGWREVGRLPIEARLRSLTSLGRLLRARTPAAKWSLPSAAGISAREAFGDPDATAALLRTVRAPSGLVTNRTPAFLAWRYGFEPLAYRAVLAGRRLEDGLVVFRLRRRGAATEAAITDVLVPASAPGLAHSLCRRALRESGADYAVRLRFDRRRGFVPLPRQGPRLVHRGLADANGVPPPRGWSLSLGDVELF
jgi:GNAT superfamily N-acetyltransferase